MSSERKELWAVVGTASGEPVDSYLTQSEADDASYVADGFEVVRYVPEAEIAKARAVGIEEAASFLEGFRYAGSGREAEWSRFLAERIRQLGAGGKP